MVTANDAAAKSSPVSLPVAGYVNRYGGLAVCTSDCSRYHNRGADPARDSSSPAPFLSPKSHDDLEVWQSGYAFDLAAIAATGIFTERNGLFGRKRRDGIVTTRSRTAGQSCPDLRCFVRTMGIAFLALAALLARGGLRQDMPLEFFESSKYSRQAAHHDAALRAVTCFCLRRAHLH